MYIYIYVTNISTKLNTYTDARVLTPKHTHTHRGAKVMTRKHIYLH